MMPREEQSPRRWQELLGLVALTVLIIAILGGLVWFYHLLTSTERLPKATERPGVGRRLADLSLLPLTGDSSEVSLRDIKGKVVLLNFWGTWCPPCRKELPHMAELRKRFEAQTAFQLLAVSCPGDGDDDVQSLRENTEALLKRLAIELPTYRDPNSITLSAVDAAIGFQAYPTTLLLDRSGVIRAIWVGYRPGVETEMEQEIGKLLDEPEAAEK
ncbi:MAG: TlpA disulfide reductase family protein [Thermoguttaceae bacterium]